jgi:hypothetical protein
MSQEYSPNKPNRLGLMTYEQPIDSVRGVSIAFDEIGLMYINSEWDTIQVCTDGSMSEYHIGGAGKGKILRCIRHEVMRKVACYGLTVLVRTFARQECDDLGAKL